MFIRFGIVNGAPMLAPFNKFTIRDYRITTRLIRQENSLNCDGNSIKRALYCCNVKSDNDTLME